LNNDHKWPQYRWVPIVAVRCPVPRCGTLLTYRVSLHMWHFAIFLRERAWLFVYLDRQVCYTHVKWVQQWSQVTKISMGTYTRRKMPDTAVCHADTIGFRYICSILPYLLVKEHQYRYILLGKFVISLWNVLNNDHKWPHYRWVPIVAVRCRVSLHISMWYFAIFLRERAQLFVYLDRQVCYTHVKWVQQWSQVTKISMGTYTRRKMPPDNAVCHANIIGYHYMCNMLPYLLEKKHQYWYILLGKFVISLWNDFNNDHKWPQYRWVPIVAVRCPVPRCGTLQSTYTIGFHYIIMWYF